MTDQANALVERLRWGEWYFEDPFDGKAYASDDPLEAADLIEAQAREIERLRGLVSSYRLQIDQLHDRAALAGDSHDA